MDGISIVFVFFVFAASCFEQTTCLPRTDGNENTYIPDKTQYNYHAQPRELHDVVESALSEQNTNRRLLEVSDTRYKLNMAWRGMKNFFTKRITKYVSPSYYRDAETGRKLRESLSDSHVVTRQSSLVVPAEKNGWRTQPSSARNNRRRNVDEDLEGPPNKDDDDEEGEEEEEEDRNSVKRKPTKSPPRKNLNRE